MRRTMRGVVHAGAPRARDGARVAAQLQQALQDRPGPTLRRAVHQTAAHAVLPAQVAHAHLCPASELLLLHMLQTRFTSSPPHVHRSQALPWTAQGPSAQGHALQARASSKASIGATLRPNWRWGAIKTHRRHG